MDKSPRYATTFFVSANEADAQRHLAVHILVSNIIDVATAHANMLNIGNPDMADINGGWVLSRLTVEMERWPAVNTSYTLETWIYCINRHFSERNFRITDERGNTLGYARSIWMVIDTQLHRNIGLSHLRFDDSIIDGGDIPVVRQQRHLPIVIPSEEKPAKYAVATVPMRQYTFKYCDIDFYRHVNTVRYVVLLLNQFTLQEMDVCRVRRLELSFMREAEYGMTVDILKSENSSEKTSIFTLCREGEHLSPLLFARITLTDR